MIIRRSTKHSKGPPSDPVATKTIPENKIIRCMDGNGDYPILTFKPDYNLHLFLGNGSYFLFVKGEEDLSHLRRIEEPGLVVTLTQT